MKGDSGGGGTGVDGDCNDSEGDKFTAVIKNIIG